MESFTITVDLRSFYNDYRAKSVIFVDTTVMKKVKHVVHHIKVIFGIEFDAFMFSQDNFVPGAEDCRVLKSLPDIKLKTLSSPSKQNNGDMFDMDDNQNEECAPTLESHRSELTNIDHGDQSNPRHASKRKKHKRKRVNSDSQDHEYSTDHQNKSDEPTSNSTSLLSAQDSKVRKISNSNSRPLNSDSYSRNDSVESITDDTPNGSFYGTKHRLACRIEEMFTEESAVKPDVTRGTGDKTQGEQLGNDSNSNTALINGKLKRKRIRRRKKATKPEDIPQDTDTSLPQIVRPLPFKSPKSFTTNSSHIFFSEEGQEELETPAKIDASNFPDEDNCVNVPLKCPDNKKEEWKEQEHVSQISVSRDTQEGQEIKNKTNISEKSIKEHDVDKSIVTEDPSKLSGTNELQTVITKSKPFSVHAESGIGKLLSLVRNSSPPVFERKKLVRTVQTPIKPITQEVAEHTPKTSSISQSNETITTLKTIPEANTKISFKILKMSASYCPELSNSIEAIVQEVNQETQELFLKLISGAVECQKPKGKFDLDLETEEKESEVKEIKVHWCELIDPYVCPN